MANEGSPSVPQQPVGRAEPFEAFVRRVAPIDAGLILAKFDNQALVAERLAAALGSALGYISADIDSDDPSTDQAWRICQDGKVALQAFESGGATKPTKADMRRAMQETINEEVIGRIDAEERAAAAEALNARYAEAAKKFDAVYGWVGLGYPDLDDEKERGMFMRDVKAAACAWFGPREALSSPADSQEQG